MKPKLSLFLNPIDANVRRYLDMVKHDKKSVYESVCSAINITEKYLSEKILGQPGVLPMEEKVFISTPMMPMMPMMPMVPPIRPLNVEHAWVMYPIIAVPYEPPPPVERKPKAERKAVRRRNRKKGHR